MVCYSVFAAYLLLLKFLSSAALMFDRVTHHLLKKHVFWFFVIIAFSFHTYFHFLVVWALLFFLMHFSALNAFVNLSQTQCFALFPKFIHLYFPW